jgi:iron complex outermembrane receptor protein
MVDGNRVNNPDMSGANWNAIPLSDIERIEVMDGSGSVLYGNNAVGGVINIITRKGGEQQTIIGISAGSFFSHRESIFHFRPVSWGNFSISAENISTDGYRERQASRSTSFTGGANIFLSDNLKLSLNAYFANLYFQLPGALNKGQFEDNPRLALRLDWSTMEYVPNDGDENTEYHFGGNTAFMWLPSENIELNLPLSYRGKFIQSDMPFWINGHSDRSLHAIEARPQGLLTFNSGVTPLRFLLGVDIYYTSIAANSYSSKNRQGEPGNSFNIYQWTLGPYLTTRFFLLDNLSVNAGLRFDIAKIEAQKHGTNVGGSENFQAFVYEGGIVYRPLQNLRFYVRYSTLFRYPYVDELAQVAGLPDDKLNFGLRPEAGFNAEAGAAWQFKESFNFAANFFFMNLSDEIAFFEDPDTWESSNINLDRTRRFGLNAAAALKPTGYLSIDASYSFVNAFFASGPNKDNKIPLVPAHSLNGGFLVTLPFGLELGPEFSYISQTFYGEDYANVMEAMDSRFLLNARARYVHNFESGELSFQINAKNLLNLSYVSYGKYFFGYALYPENGRSVNVSLQYRF